MKLNKLAAIGGVFMSLMGNAQFSPSQLAYDCYANVNYYGYFDHTQQYPIDLNNDGYLDLVTSNSGIILLYENDQQKGFNKLQDLYISIPRYATLASVFYDVNNDGFPDILSRSYNINSGHGINWMFNDGKGQFTAGPNLMTQTGPDDYANFHLLDLDGDGGRDILVLKQERPSMVLSSYFLRDLGNGVYSSLLPQAGIVDAINSQVVAEDLDGNGTQDLLVIGNYVFSYLNDGNGNYVKTNSFVNPARNKDEDFQTADFVDVDHDNDLDYYTDSTIFYNDGHGVFSYKPSNLVGAYGGYFIDMDGDNDLDLVTKNDSGGTNIVLKKYDDNLNVYNSELIHHVSFPNPNTSYFGDTIPCFSVFDIDNDGDLDIVYAHDDAIDGKTQGFYLLENLKIITSIKDQEKVKVKVYPNPASTQITIQSENDAIFQLYNSLGSKVIERRLNSTSPETIDVSEYKKGIYFLQLLNRNRELTNTEKVIIK